MTAENLIRHGLTNLFGVLGGAAICLQNAATDFFADRGINVPWVWMGVVLLAIWLGAQIRQFENGNHWVQAARQRRREFVTISLPRDQATQEGSAYFADLAFSRHVENVVVKVEVFGSWVVGWGEDWVWKRTHCTTPLKREDCNKGDIESVKLIELRPILELPASQGRDPREKERGYFKVRVTVTAHGFEPCKVQGLFLWRSKELLPSPIEMPSRDEGDGSNFSETDCVLLATK